MPAERILLEHVVKRRLQPILGTLHATSDPWARFVASNVWRTAPNRPGPHSVRCARSPSSPPRRSIAIIVPDWIGVKALDSVLGNRENPLVDRVFEVDWNGGWDRERLHGDDIVGRQKSYALSHFPPRAIEDSPPPATPR